MGEGYRIADGAEVTWVDGAGQRRGGVVRRFFPRLSMYDVAVPRERLSPRLQGVDATTLETANPDAERVPFATH